VWFDSTLWQRLSAPGRRLRWRIAKWSTSSDRQFHDDMFAAQRYDPFSPSYPGYLAIRRFADHAEGTFEDVQSVLDLGCGPGEITCELARRHPHIAFTGLDHSTVAIERAREHATRLGLANVSFAVEDLEHFQPADRVDLIMMFDAFHHLLDPSDFLSRIKPYCPRFFLIEPAGTWTGQWDRRHDLDWIASTVFQMHQRLEYEFGLQSTTASRASAPESPASATPTEHRYTVADFERLFHGFSLEFRGTIAGLEQYGPRPYEQSRLRDRLADAAYDLVVTIEEVLFEENLDLSAKHWTIFAERNDHAAATARTVRRPPSRPPAGGLLLAHGATYDSYVGPQRVRCGESFQVSLTLTNTGWLPWSSSDSQPVLLSYHWRDSRGRTLMQDGLRTPLATSFPPGHSAGVVLRVQALDAPGRALLVIDLVHEGVTWFSDQGVAPYQIRFRIMG